MHKGLSVVFPLYPQGLGKRQLAAGTGQTAQGMKGLLARIGSGEMRTRGEPGSREEEED